MKKRNFLLILLSLSISMCLMLTAGCKKDEQNKQADVTVFDISQESEWDYMAIAKDGGYLLINEMGGQPREVFYRPTADHDGYVIFLDANGRPDKAIINNYIFLFRNFSGSTLDVAVIFPDGSIEIFRNIDTGIVIEEGGLKDAEEIQSWLKVLKIAGHAAGIAACAIGIATTPAGGIGLPLVYLGCGATLVGLIGELMPEDEDQLFMGVSSASLGTVSTVAGCVTVNVACVTGGISTAASWITSSYQYIEINKESIDVAQGVLQGGYGDIQVTLTWSSVCDLDLWVTDPFGETIKWNNPTSFSGGYLDYDNMYGYGPENVFWLAGQAPSGIYQVKVHYYDGAGTSTYSVLMIVGDKVLNNGRPFTGQIVPNQTIHIADFTYGTKSELIIIDKVVETMAPEIKSH